MSKCIGVERRIALVQLEGINSLVPIHNVSYLLFFPPFAWISPTKVGKDV